MDDRQQAEHEAILAMFQTPGWAALMRNTQERVDAFRASFPFNVRNAEELWMARGVVSALDTILRLEQSYQYAMAEDAPTE